MAAGLLPTRTAAAVQYDLLPGTPFFVGNVPVRAVNFGHELPKSHSVLVGVEVPAQEGPKVPPQELVAQGACCCMLRTAHLPIHIHSMISNVLLVS